MAKKNKKNKKGDRILFAFIAAFLSIIGFVIVLITSRDDEYVMFYAKQSLVIFIVGVIAGMLKTIFLFIPIIGWIIGAALTAIVVVPWILSWVYALSGEKREIFVVSGWAEKIKL